MNHVHRWVVVDVNHSLLCRQLLLVQQAKEMSGLLDATVSVPIALQDVIQDVILGSICRRIVVVTVMVAQEEDQKCEDNHHRLAEAHVHPNRVAVVHLGISLPHIEIRIFLFISISKL